MLKFFQFSFFLFLFLFIGIDAQHGRKKKNKSGTTNTKSKSKSKSNINIREAGMFSSVPDDTANTNKIPPRKKQSKETSENLKESIKEGGKIDVDSFIRALEEKGMDKEDAIQKVLTLYCLFLFI